MADCSNSGGNSFPTAATAAGMSANLPVVYAEIAAIQQAILEATSQCPFPCNGQGGNPGTGGNTSICIGGSTPMTFMSGITAVTVVNGGAGYYTDIPAVTFVPPYGVIIPPLDTASASVTTNGTSITNIAVNPGSAGYQTVLTTAIVSSLTGSGAELLVTTSANGTIFGITVVNPGSGYLVSDAVNIIRALAPNIAYVDATALITALDISGGIVSISVLNPGAGYNPSVTQAVIVSSLNPTMQYVTGSGFQSTVLINGLTGEITGVSIINGGFGFAPLLPQLVVTDPGTGVLATVALDGTLIVPPGNGVESVTILVSGNNYTQTATATIINPVTAPSPTTPAELTLTIPVNTFCTNPGLYYQVWQGVVINESIQRQLDFVRTYFTNLGYSVKLGTNPETGSTLEWCICW